MARTSFTAAAAEVSRRDPVMAELMQRMGPFRLPPPTTDHFGALAESILYQQLAGTAAAAIHRRFMALFDGSVSPEAVLAVPEEQLRGAGLSGSKAASIRDLAAKVADGTVPLDRISRLRDDDIVMRLSVVRGIGRWTAEMFLIFQLRRLDVWPVDDYGIRQGWSLAYGLPDLLKPKELTSEGDRFRPYRTVVTWYCWQAVHESRAAKATAGRSRQ
jgi:DNA-3-methyladenine glycosylase II